MVHRVVSKMIYITGQRKQIRSSSSISISFSIPSSTTSSNLCHSLSFEKSPPASILNYISLIDMSLYSVHFLTAVKNDIHLYVCNMYLCNDALLTV